MSEDAMKSASASIKKSVKNSLKEKTFKREYATALMILWIAMAIKIVWFMPVTDVPVYEGLLMGLAWPVFTFAAAAAGIHVAQGAATTTAKG